MHARVLVVGVCTVILVILFISTITSRNAGALLRSLMIALFVVYVLLISCCCCCVLRFNHNNAEDARAVAPDRDVETGGFDSDLSYHVTVEQLSTAASTRGFLGPYGPQTSHSDSTQLHAAVAHQHTPILIRFGRIRLLNSYFFRTTRVACADQTTQTTQTEASAESAENNDKLVQL